MAQSALTYSQGSLKLIAGLTEDGYEIVIEGQLFCTSLIGDNSVVLANHFTVQRKNTLAPKIIRFGITNFEFVGNKFREDGNGGRDLGILALDLPNIDIEIEKLHNYEESVKMIN